MQETFDGEFSRLSGAIGRRRARRLHDPDARRAGAPSGASPDGRRDGAPASFALHAASPVAAAGRERDRSAVGGRSADTVDAPTSVDLPLATPVTSAFGWRVGPVHRRVALPPRRRSARQLRHRGAGGERRHGRICRRTRHLRQPRGGPRRPGRRDPLRPPVGDAGQGGRRHRRRARRSAGSARAAARRHRTCISRCWSTANESTPPSGRVASGEDH